MCALDDISTQRGNLLRSCHFSQANIRSRCYVIRCLLSHGGGFPETNKHHVTPHSISREHPSVMPFPKLLARKRIWLGIVLLLVLTTVYLYTQYTEVISETFVWSRDLVIMNRGWKRRSRRVSYQCSSGSQCRTSPGSATAGTPSRDTASSWTNSVAIALFLSEIELCVVIIVGFVCQLPEVQSSGCCQGSRRYECSSCQDTGCCAVYEHCVSCCLHPDKVL